MHDFDIICWPRPRAAPAFDAETATRAYLDTLQRRGAGQVRRLFRGRLLAALVGRAGLDPGLLADAAARLVGVVERVGGQA